MHGDRVARKSVIECFIIARAVLALRRICVHLC
jgi:hypothetical protein